MKNFYRLSLLAVSLIASASVSAQDVKVSWLFDETLDGKTVPSMEATSNNTNFIGSNLKLDSGVSQNLSVPSVKDKDGNNQNKLTGNFLGVKHVYSDNLADQQPNIKLSFKIDAQDNQRFNFTGLSMDLASCGSDYVCVQVVIRSEGKETTSVTAITEENHQDLSEYGGWLRLPYYIYEEVCAVMTGWHPSRNDGSKPDYTNNVVDGTTYINRQSPDGYSHLVIPASAVPEITGESQTFIVDVYFWGYSDKALAIRKVSVEGNSSVATSGLKLINSDNKEETVFNLAGQRVASDFKGIVIRGGKKVVVK